MDRKLKLVNSEESLSIRRQSELLSVPRGRVYYEPLGESAENLALMLKIDKIVTAEPTFGILRIQDSLRDAGVFVNHKRIRRLTRKMGLEAIYPRKNLSKSGLAKYIKPYLLKGYEATE